MTEDWGREAFLNFGVSGLIESKGQQGLKGRKSHINCELHVVDGMGDGLT